MLESTAIFWRYAAVKISISQLATVFVLILPNIAISAGLPPWEFGMTKDQVASFKQFGPYKKFSNGDLETFNGVFQRKTHNVQFYFQNNKLIKIEVLLGEGTNRDKAIATFKDAYRILEAQYGKVIIPEEPVSSPKSSVDLTARAIAAAVNASVTGYTHINPVNQPRDMHVWGTIASTMVGGDRWFYVGIMFGPR